MLSETFTKWIIDGSSKEIMMIALSFFLLNSSKINDLLNEKQTIHFKPILLPNIHEVNWQEFRNEYCKTKIFYFARIMSKYFSKNDLPLFYHNISHLKTSSIILEENYAEYYDVKKNKIFIKEIPAIYHGLFHVASSIDKDGIIFSGFSQSTNLNSIGIGITEGYTELLAERYFGNIKGVKRYYPIETFIMKQIEVVIGKEKMTNFYFHADLLGLMNEFHKYLSKEDSLELIQSMDFLVNHLHTTENLSTEINQHLSFIFQILFKMYWKKLEKDRTLNEELRKMKMAMYQNNLQQSLYEIESFKRFSFLENFQEKKLILMKTNKR